MPIPCQVPATTIHFPRPERRQPNKKTLPPKTLSTFQYHPMSTPNPIPPDSDSDSDSDPSPSTASPDPRVFHLSFNQDHSCFAAGLDSGFLFFQCHPFRPLFRRRAGGVGCVSMLFRSNLQALVGAGPHPAFPPNKVMIWDRDAGRCIVELSFRSEVKAVRLRLDKILVVLLHRIFVYNFSDLKLEHQIDTGPNPGGICEISQASSPVVLACPGVLKGQLRLDTFGPKRTRYVAAHQSKLACIAMTQNGRVLATAGCKGTLVRVFNALDGTLLQEVRRGADRAAIYSLAFSSNARWLAVSSDKGTVHVFGLKVDSGVVATLAGDRPNIAPEQHQASGFGISSLSIFKGVLPKYFSSEWSVARFRLPAGLRSTVAFGSQRNTVLIVGIDGSFYRCEFDPENGGEMTQLEHHNFLDVDDSSTQQGS